MLYSGKSWAGIYTQVFQVEEQREHAKMLHVDFFDFKKCSLANLLRIHQFCPLKMLVKNEVQMRGGERLLLGDASLFTSTFIHPYKMFSSSEFLL